MKEPGDVDKAETMSELGRLRVSHTLLETILTQAAEGIAACDTSGRLTFVNPAARRLAGLDPDAQETDIPWSAWGQAHDAQGRVVDQTEWSLGRALKGQRTAGKKCHMVRADGGAYDVLVSASPLTDAENVIVGAVAVLVDVTKQSRTEQALEQVRERERQQRDQLATLGQIAAGVANELNNMLQAVMMHAEMARHHLNPADAASRNIESILNQATRGALLTREIIELAGQDERSVPPPRAEAELAGLRRGNGELILVVDDEPPVLAVVTEGLQELGYRVLTAPSAGIGLELFDQHSDEVALVLSDVAMPEMDGVEYVQHLRKRCDEVKVVLMSGYPKSRAQGAVAVDGWLSKPFSLGQLFEVVTETLSPT